MKEKTVKKRIFISNTLMVIVSLILFFVINVVLLKIYFYSVENQTIPNTNMTVGAIEDIIESWIYQNGQIFLLIFVDMIICALILLFVSQIFTKNLIHHMSYPLDELSKATQRIKNNNFSEDIEYSGEEEFENVCQTFNEMQKSLLQAKLTQQQYEKARTDMIIGISHDLKTPLTVIKGVLKAMIDKMIVSTTQQDEMLKIAYQRTDDMTALLNQFLYISKLETDDIPIHLENVEMNIYLKEYANQIVSPKIHIECQLNHEDIYVKIDPQQFKRILDNLVENSCKYAAVESLHITISTHVKENILEVCFQDNGKGVDEGKLPYIFDEFYRSDESRNQKEGHGLGLFIVKDLVEKMDGYVRAENNHGLRICLSLPIK